MDFFNNSICFIIFAESECSGKCHEIEEQLLSIREELADAIGAWVIKSYAPETLESWGGPPDKDTIMFVRHGAPMLYTGTAISEDADEMLNYFIMNKESNLLHLDDDTFEVSIERYAAPVLNAGQRQYVSLGAYSISIWSSYCLLSS